MARWRLGRAATTRARSPSSVDQCEGLPPAFVVTPPPVAEGLILPEVEAIGRRSNADVRLGGERAFDAPGADYIQLPRPEAFFEPIYWHQTALYEIGHWTGTPHRLGRDLCHDFDSPGYAREELVAKICAAFSSAARGITPTVRLGDGSRCCARTTAPSCELPRPPPRRPTTCWPSSPRRDDGRHAGGGVMVPSPSPVDAADAIRLRVLSLSAGVRSTTLALMAAHGEVGPMPDCAVFADTGLEPRAVYDHLAWLMSPNVPPFPVYVVKHRPARRPAAGGRGRLLGVESRLYAESGGAPSTAA